MIPIHTAVAITPTMLTTQAGVKRSDRIAVGR